MSFGGSGTTRTGACATRRQGAFLPNALFDMRDDSDDMVREFVLARIAQERPELPGGNVVAFRTRNAQQTSFRR